MSLINSSPVTPQLKRPRLVWTPERTPEKLEEGSLNIVIQRGYSSYGGLRWKTKSKEREYLTRLCRSLIDYGAPAHHLEEILLYAASHLAVDLAVQITAESVLLSFSDDLAPTLPLISGDWETVHLAWLRDTYKVHDSVVDFKITVKEAVSELADIAERANYYHERLIIFVYGIACACIGPLVFGAHLVDIPVIFVLGCLIGLLKGLIKTKSKHRDILEFLTIALTSFAARALGSLSGGQLCFSALAQAPLVMLLPGYTITWGCLQLTSTSKGAGSSRIIFAIVYSLILGFSVSVGTAAYGCIDKNATSQNVCLDTMPWYFPYMFLPPLAICITILNQGRWQQMPVVAAITISGYAVTTLVRKRLVTELSNLSGAFVLGCLINLYSAVTRRSAADILLAGLFIQVPSGLAAHGSMVQSVATADIMTQFTMNGTALMTAAATGMDSVIDITVPLSMARVAIMLALGLRLSASASYLLGQRRLNC